MSERNQAWAQFQEDLQKLTSSLRAHYHSPEDEEAINHELLQLEKTASALFSTIQAASSSPAVNAAATASATSFVHALRASLHDLTSNLSNDTTPSSPSSS